MSVTSGRYTNSTESSISTHISPETNGTDRRYNFDSSARQNASEPSYVSARAETDAASETLLRTQQEANTTYSAIHANNARLGEMEARLDHAQNGPIPASPETIAQYEERLEILNERNNTLSSQHEDQTTAFNNAKEDYTEAYNREREESQNIVSSGAGSNYHQDYVEGKVPSEDKFVSNTLNAKNARSHERDTITQSEASELQNLKEQTEKEIAELENEINNSRSNGGNIQELENKLLAKKNVLDQVSSAITQGRTRGVAEESPTCTGRGIQAPSRGLPRPNMSGITLNGPGTGETGSPTGPDGRVTTTSWDAPVGEGWISGVMEDIIVAEIEPKYKHAYRGIFFGQLEHLDFLIKTMDRPKIDIEYVEQIRNNVVRYYPVKYSFGDLSLTFWDDIRHQTVTTITEYFHDHVWNHDPDGSGSKKERGELLMRDKTVIPKLQVVDYVMHTKQPLTYTFYNCSLSSFDLDNHDDEEDSGVHTVQVVLKIEGYSIAIGLQYGPSLADGPGGGANAIEKPTSQSITNTLGVIAGAKRVAGSGPVDALGVAVASTDIVSTVTGAVNTVAGAVNNASSATTGIG